MLWLGDQGMCQMLWDKNIKAYKTEKFRFSGLHPIPSMKTIKNIFVVVQEVLIEIH